MAIRAGDYKLVRYDSNADTRTGGKRQPTTAGKLYNLAADIGETKDLAAAQPEKVKDLQVKWDAWNKSNIAPLWALAKPTTMAPNPAPHRPQKANATGETMI